MTSFNHILRLNAINIIAAPAYLLALTLMIGGCASQSSLVSESAQAPSITNEQVKPEDLQDTLEVEAHLLLKAINHYQQSKQALSGEQHKQAKTVMAKIAQQQWMQAQALLEPLLLEGKASSLFVLAGDIANGMGKIEDAVTAYQKAVAVNHSNFYAHNRLAMLCRQQGQFEQALKHYNLAIDAWPGFSAAYRNRGILKDLYMGQKQQALKDYALYQQLIQLNQSEDNRVARQVKAWVADLRRQIDSEAANGNIQQGVARVQD